MEEKINAQNELIGKNSLEIRELRREMDLMKSEYERMMNEVGARVNELGEMD